MKHRICYKTFRFVRYESEGGRHLCGENLGTESQGSLDDRTEVGIEPAQEPLGKFSLGLAGIEAQAHEHGPR